MASFFGKSASRQSNKTARQRPDANVTTRIVTDKRWVHRNQLKLGMYVSELDRPWEETRFMFQGFVIDSVELLQALQDSCEYAQIKTEKLARISTNSDSRLCGSYGGRG